MSSPTGFSWPESYGVSYCAGHQRFNKERLAFRWPNLLSVQEKQRLRSRQIRAGAAVTVASGLKLASPISWLHLRTSKLGRGAPAFVREQLFSATLPRILPHF